MTFDYERLTVYQRSLAFCGAVEHLVQGWDARHAITDHLPRAAESTVVNLAEACATYSQARTGTLDYSLGSALECAACLDIAGIKGLLDATAVLRRKQELLEIFRMLVGLRTAWAKRMVREEPTSYGSERHPTEEAPVFHHESLDVYRLGLEIVRLLCGDMDDMPIVLFRKLDAGATSIVLNLAEGNGRFSELDHRRFVEVAYRATIKFAAQIDLCAQKRIMEAGRVEAFKRLLLRVASMTAALRRKE